MLEQHMVKQDVDKSINDPLDQRRLNQLKVKTKGTLKQNNILNGNIRNPQSPSHFNQTHIMNL